MRCRLDWPFRSEWMQRGVGSKQDRPQQRNLVPILPVIGSEIRRRTLVGDSPPPSTEQRYQKEGWTSPQMLLRPHGEPCLPHQHHRHPVTTITPYHWPLSSCLKKKRLLSFKSSTEASSSFFREQKCAGGEAKGQNGRKIRCEGGSVPKGEARPKPTKIAKSERVGLGLRPCLRLRIFYHKI